MCVFITAVPIIVCHGKLAMEEETIHGWSMTSVIFSSDLKSLGIQNYK